MAAGGPLWAAPLFFHVFGLAGPTIWRGVDTHPLKYLIAVPYTEAMRYLVRALVKPGRERALLDAIDRGTLGRGSIAGDEYLRDMNAARLCDDGTARWVEICFCPTPLMEERSYWEEYFELTRVQDAHDRRRCRDQNGTEPWACIDCDCTVRLEQRLETKGEPFLKTLRRDASVTGSCPRG